MVATHSVLLWTEELRVLCLFALDTLVVYAVSIRYTYIPSILLVKTIEIIVYPRRRQGITNLRLLLWFYIRVISVTYQEAHEVQFIPLLSQKLH